MIVSRYDTADNKSINIHRCHGLPLWGYGYFFFRLLWWLWTGRCKHRDSKGGGETMRPDAGAQKYSSGNRASRRAVAAASFGFNFLLAATQGLDQGFLQTIS